MELPGLSTLVRVRSSFSGIFFLLAALSLACSSCSGLSTPPGGLGVPHLESRSSEKRPLWIDSPGLWQSRHPDREYFVGSTSKEPDQESGRTDAYENAMRSIAERIGERASSLYREESLRRMGTGSSGMDMSVRRHVASLVMTQAQARISGARVEDYYWRKYWEKDRKEESPYSFYKYHVLVSIRKDLYERLLRKSLTAARDSERDPRTKALLDRMLRDESSGPSD